jgi:hypothetical protein
MNRLTEREAEHHSMARRQLSRVTHIWGPNRLRASLNIAPLDGELPINDSIPEVDTMDEESTVARIPKRFTLIIRNKTSCYISITECIHVIGIYHCYVSVGLQLSNISVEGRPGPVGISSVCPSKFPTVPVPLLSLLDKPPHASHHERCLTPARQYGWP